MITDIYDLISKSKQEDENFGDDISCKFTIYEDGIDHDVYNANIAYRDILLYTNKGVLNYSVDSYGFNDTIELVSIKLD